MKTTFFLISAFLLFANCSIAQTHKFDEYLKMFPPKGKTENAPPAKYRMTIDWENRNLLGASIHRNIVSGFFVSKLENDTNTTRWSDIELKTISNGNQETIKLTNLEGLEYQIIGDNITTLDFYSSFPQESIELIRWFVQDQGTFDVFGIMYLDSLEFCKPFKPGFFQNQRTDFVDYVNVTSMNIELEWIGISKKNKKVCALINFKGMYSPLDSDTDVMKLNARTCYWGTIWVSLPDRQIEYGLMNEDVIIDMKLKQDNVKKSINLQRQIVLEKVD